MPRVSIVPTDDKPVPYDTSPDCTGSLLEELAVAGRTAELQEELGAFNGLHTSSDDAEREKSLIDEVVEKGKSKNLQNQTTALAASAFLKTYGHQLGMDAATTRAALTNKLLEIANCGDTKHELKALELLGKHSDIGLFTERSEININYNDPSQLEEQIKERVKRLLNAQVVDVEPISGDLDNELGVLNAPAVEDSPDEPEENKNPEDNDDTTDTEVKATPGKG